MFGVEAFGHTGPFMKNFNGCWKLGVFNQLIAMPFFILNKMVVLRNC